MPRYIMLTRLATPGSMRPSEHGSFESRLHAACPDVRWLASYAILGPYDFLDVFEAPGNEIAADVARLVRASGAAMTEIWPVAGPGRFRDVAGLMPARRAVHDEVAEASEESFPASDPPAWTGSAAT